MQTTKQKDKPTKKERKNYLHLETVWWHFTPRIEEKSLREKKWMNYKGQKKKKIRLASALFWQYWMKEDNSKVLRGENIMSQEFCPHVYYSQVGGQNKSISEI